MKIGIGDQRVRADDRVLADDQRLGGAKADTTHPDPFANIKHGSGRNGAESRAGATNDRIRCRTRIDPDTLAKHHVSASHAANDWTPAHYDAWMHGSSPQSGVRPPERQLKGHKNGDDPAEHRVVQEVFMFSGGWWLQRTKRLSGHRVEARIKRIIAATSGK
jgi:hypothetical protein